MRELLMLAKEYINQDIRGWYMSEKMDGFRAWWDGGISRGRVGVPWAKSTEKEATGLWSRYGNVIHAPVWFLDSLPAFSLDGELWCGRGSFQQTMSACRKLEPVDSEWREVQFRAFDTPNYDAVFTTGEINNPNFKKIIRHDDCVSWIKDHDLPMMLFTDVVGWMELQTFWNAVVTYVVQEQLPDFSDGVKEAVERKLASVLENHGEGLMFRNPRSMWCPNRTDYLLKLKPELDAEGEILGYVWGAGKYENMMGAMIVEWKEKIFELSGFTDLERGLRAAGPVPAGMPRIPKTRIPDCLECMMFARHEQVTFKYRELTDAGYPKEARYWRKP